MHRSSVGLRRASSPYTDNPLYRETSENRSRGGWNCP